MIWDGPLDEFARGIAQREGCSEDRALETARELSDLHFDLRVPFAKWWQEGGLPTVPDVHGYTAERLISEGWCETVPVAFTWLDGLLKRPEKTREFLRVGRGFITPDCKWLADEAELAQESRASKLGDE